MAEEHLPDSCHVVTFDSDEEPVHVTSCESDRLPTFETVDLPQVTQQPPPTYIPANFSEISVVAPKVTVPTRGRSRESRGCTNSRARGSRRGNASAVRSRGGDSGDPPGDPEPARRGARVGNSSREAVLAWA
jgi:hypothetical protein